MLRYMSTRIIRPNLAGNSKDLLRQCRWKTKDVLMRATLPAASSPAPLGSSSRACFSGGVVAPIKQEKQRLEAIRRQGESKRRAHSVDKTGAKQSQDPPRVENGYSSHLPPATSGIQLTEVPEQCLKEIEPERIPVESNALSNGKAVEGEKEDSEGEAAEVEPVVEPLPTDVYIVSKKAQAQRVVALLTNAYKDRCHACDTEVADIDVKAASPIGHGKLISFSIFCGKDAHFGVLRNKKLNQNKVWVDLLDCDDRDGILNTFRPYFESPDTKKVWHNYSFDRHILSNENIRCQGFYADTMHMARLWDSSRITKGGYSLESLSGDTKLMGQKSKLFKKTSMKELFGKPNIKKDNTEGKLIVVPSVDTLQQSEETRARWIKYCALDAVATWQVHESLKHRLCKIPCEGDGVNMSEMFGHLTRTDELKASASNGSKRSSEKDSSNSAFNMFDFYQNFWRPFGALLTDMEDAGVLVDPKHLRDIETIAVEDQIKAREFFKKWSSERVPDAKLVNVGSALQLRQLLFAGAANFKKPDEKVEMVRMFKVPNEEGIIEEGKKKPKKNVEIELHGLWGKETPSPLKPEQFTPSGWPSSNTPVFRNLAGKPGVAQKLMKEGENNGDDKSLSGLDHDFTEDVLAEDAHTFGSTGDTNGNVQKGKLDKEAEELGLGKAYSAFGGGPDGIHACAAIDSLCDVAAIDTLLSNFIIPLQGDLIKCKQGRIHCSMNINTETGRLSARRPNLQNQPALEKDRYRIRQAFTADVASGKTLIVADYGQLELRLLAHMTKCQSMLEAFSSGGDFHSRTALGMYEHIQQAIDRGECILEWDGGKGEPAPVPLVKDMFSTERRKAKILNFSIAYGKTAHGLAKDWDVSLREAEETVRRWYRDRPEVQAWQEQRIVEAHSTKRVRTLLGRHRHLHQINTKDRSVQKHLERAAINTPIQGGAADIAMLAMLEIQRCEELRDLGWTLLLQVHDEVMLEGPAESRERALELVVKCMEFPFYGENPLLVGLNVDAKSSNTWYGAK